MVLSRFILDLRVLLFTDSHQEESEHATSTLIFGFTAADVVGNLGATVKAHHRPDADSATCPKWDYDDEAPEFSADPFTAGIEATVVGLAGAGEEARSRPRP